jgi:hypothetical protein
MGECDCAICEKCREAMGENALEVYRLRLLLDEVRGIVGSGLEVPEKLRPQVIWDLADWQKRAVPSPSLPSEDK